jgi:hypothetical protein
MKLALSFLFAALSVASVTQAQPTGLALNPVLSVTSASGETRIVGNMLLPPNVPSPHVQVNAAVFATNIDKIGCAAVAQSQIGSGKSFVIIGEVANIYAVNGVFTMRFSSLSSCTLN